MTPDQYRREGAEAMRAYIANKCDPAHLSRSDNPTEFHAGYRHAVIGKFTVIRAIDVDEVLAAMTHVSEAQLVEAMKHLHDIINCGNCSGSRQSARLALRALKGEKA